MWSASVPEVFWVPREARQAGRALVQRCSRHHGRSRAGQRPAIAAIARQRLLRPRPSTGVVGLLALGPWAPSPRSLRPLTRSSRCKRWANRRLAGRAAALAGAGLLSGRVVPVGEDLALIQCSGQVELSAEISAATRRPPLHGPPSDWGWARRTLGYRWYEASVFRRLSSPRKLSSGLPSCGSRSPRSRTGCG